MTDAKDIEMQELSNQNSPDIADTSPEQIIVPESWSEERKSIYKLFKKVSNPNNKNDSKSVNFSVRR